MEPTRPARRMGEAKCEMAWKRLVKALILMLVTARQQMVLDHLNQRSIELEPENSRTDPEDQSTKKKNKKTFNKNEYIFQGIGRPLPRSEAHKHFPTLPEKCQHPADALRCRANVNNHWWTCTRCGNRWQRLKEDEFNTLPPVATMPDHHLTDGFPTKLVNARGQEFPRVLPPPKARPQQGEREVVMERTGKVKVRTVGIVESTRTTTPPAPTTTTATTSTTGPFTSSSRPPRMTASTRGSKASSSDRKSPSPTRRLSGVNPARPHKMRPAASAGYLMKDEVEEFLLTESEWSDLEMIEMPEDAEHPGPP